MEEIFYRQLIPGDYAQYKRVRLDSLKQYPDYFGGTYEEELNSESLKLDNAIRMADKGNFVFGAFALNDNLVGICGLVTEKRLKTRHRGEIVQVYVDPRYGKRGIAKKLLQLTIDQAFTYAEIDMLTLGVDATNQQAINLYTQFGFKEYGRLENFFKSNSRYFTQVFFFLKKTKRVAPDDTE